jgi:exosortase J
MPSPHGADLSGSTKLTPPASAFVLPARAALALGLAMAGILSILPTATGLWSSWHDGPIESTGMLIAVAGVLLVLRVWHSMVWEMQGTWWGLGLLLLTVAGVHFRSQVLLEVTAGPRAMSIPPAALWVLAYTVGMVLLFAGPRLLRRAVFPVALLAFVEPVPALLGRFLELRLFHLSALAVLGMARLLRQELPQDFFRMFSWQDSGLRAAMTMGLLALIAGYMYRFRPRLRVAATLVALLLGIAFHLVRLCLLVTYFAVAQHVPSLRSHIATADYLLGIGVFFAATLTLMRVVQRCSPTRDLKPPTLPAERTVASSRAMPSFSARWVALALLLALGSVGSLGFLIHGRSGNVAAAFPQQMGTYTLSREWDESVSSGEVTFHWAEYISEAGGPMIAIGITPTLRPEDALRSLAAGREGRLWRGGVSLGRTRFDESFFADGVTQSLEVSTVCNETTCGVYASAGAHLIYSLPHLRALLTQTPSRPVSVLLKTETLDIGISPPQAREELTQTLRQFIDSKPIYDFTTPYRQ